MQHSVYNDNFERNQERRQVLKAVLSEVDKMDWLNGKSFKCF